MPFGPSLGEVGWLWLLPVVAMAAMAPPVVIRWARRRSAESPPTNEGLIAEIDTTRFDRMFGVGQWVHCDTGHPLGIHHRAYHGRGAAAEARPKVTYDHHQQAGQPATATIYVNGVPVFSGVEHSAALAVSPPLVCPMCHGDGLVREATSTANPFCRRCGGSGEAW